jgi:hypothetical protein
MGRSGWLAGAAGLVVLAPMALALAAPPPAASPGADPAFFESKVRPLLIARCSKCHGEKVQQAGLRLDTAEGFRKGSERGAVVLAANPAQSPLLRAVRHEGGLVMPPGEQLSDAEIAALTAWVSAGAPWPAVGKPGSPAPPSLGGLGGAPPSTRHWSFLPVKRPAVPAVKNKAWVKNPVDAFILAKLEAKGLSPSPPASRRELIRRATFDLTGLPPTPEEIQAFLADRSPQAWEKVVDRLLASPAYGERWGRHWLDLARYADSKDVRDIGAPYDIVESYRYRDWVIQAFNRDLPYDQFITQQIAGDLLPPPAPGEVNADALTATTFLTIGCWGPGDADLQKMYADMVDDQINAVSRAFLGVTIGCARCHDHKFDPISTADYYGLAGIFFSTQIATPQISAPYNKVPLVPPAEIERREKYLARIPEMQKQVQRFVDARYAEVPRQFIPQAAAYLTAAWDLQHPGAAGAPQPAALATERGLREEALKQWLEYLAPAPASAASGLMTTLMLDSNGNKGVHTWKGLASEPVLTVNTTDATVHVPGTMPPHSVAVHPGPSTGVALAWKSPVSGVVRVTGRIADAHAGCGDGAAWTIDRVQAGGVESLASDSFEDGGATPLAQAADAPRLQNVRIVAGDELRFVVLPKTNHGCDLTLLEVQIEEVGGGGRVWNAAKDLVAGPFRPGMDNPHADSLGNPGVWSFLDMALVKDAVHAHRGPEGALARWYAAGDRAAAEAAAAEIQRALAAPGTSEEGTPAGRLWRELASGQGPFRVTQRDDHWLPAAVLVEKKRLEAEFEAYRKNAPPPVPYAMAAREGGVAGTKYEGFHDAAIHIRGRYDRLGDVVPRRFPLVLAGAHQPPITQGSGRLELARWIASPQNPLTARVLVNRVWQHHFGQGLVRTPGNFGKMGEAPTHPELLDWLAGDFVAGEGSGFRVQGTGNTHTPTHPHIQPWSIKRLHRLLMLSNTYRQSSKPRAELASDPENRLWARASVRRLEAEAVRDTLLAVSGKLDRTLGGPPLRKPGEDAMSARRAVYLMTNRSDKTGLRFLFDAADPENIVDQRTVSTVAPQSLFLMNDPFMLEQTRALADRLMAPEGRTPEQRIGQAYELLYGRPATPRETALGRGFLEAHGAGEKERRAAWLEYCQVLLCANELIYVD